MYAPAFGEEVFDNDKLVVDVIVEAVMRMRANGGPHVIVVNLSLGDRTKPFSGKISTWCASDYLAFTYGILISCECWKYCRRNSNARVRDRRHVRSRVAG